MERFRQQIRYAADSHSCHRCGVSQHLCATGAEVSRACQWPGAVVPILFGAMQSESGFHEVQIAGYQAEYQDLAAYGQWLGQRHFQRIWGENMSNGMAVVLRIIRFVHDVEGTSVSGQGDTTEGSDEDTTEGSVESGDIY